MPSTAGQLAHARNSARISPSFRESGEGNIAPPTGMMQGTKPEGASDDGGGYEPRAFAGGGEAADRGAAPPSRDTMMGPTGFAGASAMPDMSAQLNPLNKPKVFAKILRSLVPDQWLTWLSLDSWKDPLEIGLRLSILKISFWVVVVGLIIVAAMAAIEALNPLS